MATASESTHFHTNQTTPSISGQVRLYIYIYIYIAMPVTLDVCVCGRESGFVRAPMHYELPMCFMQIHAHVQAVQD